MAGFQVIMYGRFWVFTEGQESLIAEDFPVFSLQTRDLAPETSSHQTAPTAT